jgi:hypothetical protein
MNTAAVLPLAAGAPRRGAPRAGLAPGARYWHAQAHDRIWVRFVFAPLNRIEVDIWWNRLVRRPDVQLILGLDENSAELGCLTGNGFDTPGLHRLGFGTFAVNIAVQALKAGFAPSFRVHGVLSNTVEQDLPREERLRLEENRRAFWRRFGLDILQLGEPPLDCLSGSVGRLHIVARGSLAGQFPRCVSLGDFTEQRPAGL